MRADERDCPHCGVPLPAAGVSSVISAAAVAAGLAAFAVSALGPAGCGPNVSGQGGTGGEGGGDMGGAYTGGNSGGTMNPMTTTVVTTYGPAPTTTTGPVDCTAQVDFTSCANCFAEQHPDGAAVYNDLVVCVICSACYTSCDGANSGCPSAPPTKDACDGDMPDNAACGDSMSGCIQCSQAGSCSDELMTCQMNQDCVDFVTAIGDCPQN